MAYTELSLIDGTLLTGSDVTLYTCTAPVVSTIIKEISVCNTTSSVYTFDIHIVPSGQTVGDQYALFKGVTMQPNETKIFGLSTVLEVGDFISGVASTTSVLAISASGVERE